MSWNKIIIKLIIPYLIFVVFFISRHMDGYLCDCFENFGLDIIILMAVTFFIGLMSIVYQIKKNKKEWKFYYTILAMILFVFVFYIIMAVGEYLYVPPKWPIN